MADDPGAAMRGAPVNQGATGAGPEGEATYRGPAYSGSGGDQFEERPELFVGGAFVGGLALAILLKRLAA